VHREGDRYSVDFARFAAVSDPNCDWDESDRFLGEMGRP